MLTTDEIARLQFFDAEDLCVLSAYLDLDPARQVERTYKVVFRDLVDAAGHGLDRTTCSRLEKEAKETWGWLERQEPQGKGLALFSCTPRAFWDAYYLPVRVPDRVVFEPRPDVNPLLDVVDEYERYAVAVVDKGRARLFTVFLGAIEESEAFEDFVRRKTDQGSLSQTNYERHHEAHVRWHFRRVADHLARLLRRHPFDRLIIGGPEEATAALRRSLSRPVASRLAAVIRVEAAASAKRILDKTLEVEAGIERAVEERLLAELLETAGGGGRAAHGVAPTLDALWRSEVQTLVVAEDARLAGGECPTCGHLYGKRETTCLLDGTAIRTVPDLTRRAVECALELAGSVEFLHGQPAQRLVEAGGGLGAVLRFR